ncbi:hypothetical protein [Pseudobacteriovorax antillogorgiicola]|uniref:Uncharacterized protein n=1 Tax=Pseudobacteriovorax antillogorgiicola TaxID=1513793 RepID=A0A1Y6C2X5_9BACT|nr:hypothetical protein [Pseudobacteriovorax antillogorgiicola]TCS49795.1 hypothetical protein EDD56_11440 [Pseudobacteriovorax antillogorgiicola]SMF42984.1 hypothetical protein SAMN06296036_11339 [Pseudobacteriovorax antillogorgiicola]
MDRDEKLKLRVDLLNIARDIELGLPKNILLHRIADVLDGLNIEGGSVSGTNPGNVTPIRD